jgi:hypothetical protein
MIVAFTGEAHPNKFVLQTKLDFRSVETRDHKFISQYFEELIGVISSPLLGLNGLAFMPTFWV